MLIVLISWSEIVVLDSKANTSVGDFASHISCTSKMLKGFTSNSLQVLERGDFEGLKVVVHRNELTNSTTDWMIIREDNTHNIFFSVFLWNHMAKWAMSAYFLTNVVSISENPKSCLGDFRESNFHERIRQILLEELYARGSRSYSLCSVEFNNVTGNTIQTLNCCKLNEYGNVYCEEIKTEGFVIIFFIVLFVLKILLVVSIVRFVPESLYRKRHCYKEFVFSMKSPLEMEITKRFSPPPRVSKLRTVELGTRYKFCGYQYRLKFGENLDRLSTLLETMEMSKTENYKLRAVWFKVDPSQLVWKNRTPVGFLSFLYRRLFQCKCYVHGRKQKVLENSEVSEDGEYVSLHNCCNRKISRNISWESLVRNMVQAFATLFVFLVPIIVIKIVWNNEERFIRNKLEAVKFYNSTPTFPFYSLRLGSASFLYGFYKVFQGCFVLWFLPLLMLIVMRIATDNTLWKRTVWIFVRSLVYVKHFSTIGTSWATSFLLQSFTSSALTDVNAVNVFVWIIVKLASVVIIVSFLLFCKLSFVNLLLQLLWRFSREILRCLKATKGDDKRSDMEDLVQENSQNSCCEKSLRGLLNLPSFESCGVVAEETIFPRSSCGRFTWCCFCLGWIVFIICGLPIVVDLIFILVDTLTFIIIGLIINIRHLAHYFLITFYVCVYVSMYFKQVEQTFQHFNTELQSFLLERHTRSLISRNLMGDTTPDANRCYQVIPGKGCGKCAACHVFASKNGKPKWKARHLVQFVDDNGEPCIPKNFFFQACYMNHHACPGSLSNHFYEAAMKSFLWTVYIIVAVLLVKITHPGFPWWGHLLILAILGLLPIIFKQLYFFGPKQKNIDKKDDIFKQKVEHVIREYKQEWPVIDLEVSRRATLDDSIASLLEGNDDINNDNKCWFQTPNKTCVCLNIPNQKPISVENTVQTESAPPTPGNRTHFRNGLNKSRSLRGQWSTFDSNISRQSFKFLHTTPSLSPSKRSASTNLKSSGSLTGCLEESLDPVEDRLPTRSLSGRQKNARVPSSEIKHEGPEGIHFLPKSYPGSCCVSTKDDTISIASTLSNHSHDLHNQETMSSIWKNMKSLNQDKTATQTLVADV